MELNGLIRASVRDRWGFQVKKPYKTSYMTWQISSKFIMIWQKQWELTCSNSLLTCNLENVCGILWTGRKWCVILILTIWSSCQHTLLSMRSRCSVDRAPTWCSGGHGFDSCRGLRFFFVPHSCHVEYFIFHKISWFSKKPVMWPWRSQWECILENVEEGKTLSGYLGSHYLVREISFIWL